MEGFLLNFTFCLCRITSSQWQAGASQRTGPNTGSSETPGASSGLVESQRPSKGFGLICSALQQPHETCGFKKKNALKKLNALKK